MVYNQDEVLTTELRHSSTEKSIMRTIYRLYRYTGYSPILATIRAIRSRARNMSVDEGAWLFFALCCIGWILQNLWRLL